MSNLHDIQSRINSVQSTRQITNTMYMIASTKVSKSAKRLEDTHPYSGAICKMLANTADGNADFKHPLLENHEDNKTTLLIVIVSDQGLAGGFNSNVLRATQARIDQNNRESKNTKLIVCGKKAQAYFNFRKLKTEMEYINSSADPKFEQAEEIGNYCIENYLDENIDEVTLIYNRCKNSMEQIVEESLVLPVSAEKLNNMLSKVVKQQDEQSSDFLKEIVYEPNTNEVLSSLIPVYVRTVIFDALIDSAAGEQVARRLAMQSATDNADEMLETLTRLFNRIRQESITTELNEITGGAAALEENA